MLRTEAGRLDLVSRMVGGKAGEWIRDYGRIVCISWDDGSFTVTSMGGAVRKVPVNAAFKITFPKPMDNEVMMDISGSPYVAEIKTEYRMPGTVPEVEMTIVIPAEKMEDNNEDSGCWKIKADSWSG